MSKRREKKLTAADLFCGAGGTTTGAEMSGRVDVILAVNHWRAAIYSHQANHPNTRHICARIDDIDPRNDRTIPDFDVLLASPECTHHSIARGGRPIDDQKRATPWHVCAWAEAKRPKWLVVENVREFRDWGPLDEHCRPIKSRKGETFAAWIRSIESLGYQVDHQLLNAADFGAATSRTRLFIVARRGRSRRDIPWPEITHPKADWRPAWSIIDWQKPCPSIFQRTRPLAEKTLRRIEIGLRKFVGEAFQLKAIGRSPGLTRGMDEPVPTIVAARENHAVVMPFMLPRQGFYDCWKDKPSRSLGEPVPTITANHGPGHIVVPFLVNYHGGIRPDRDGSERSNSVSEPIPVIPTENRYGLVQPFLLAINHGGDDDRSKSPQRPLATLTTKTGHSVVLPFLAKYYGTGDVQPVSEPLDTITTRDRFGLAMASLLETMQELQVVDIGFRMLDAGELARAQGFPENYHLHGTKAEQVKQIGNSVSPPVAAALCKTIAEAV